MIFFKDDICIYAGGLNPVLHAHHALEISIGINAPLNVWINKRAPFETKACIILPNQNHKIYIDPEQGEKITILLDADLPLTKAIIHGPLKKSKEYYNPDYSSLVPYINRIYFERRVNQQDLELNIFRILNELFLCLFPDCKDNHNNKIDQRVTEVLTFIHENIDNKNLKFSDIAEKVKLSESRLAHLFKNEIGIPYRKYILWTRLKIAVTEILKNGSITSASHTAGFSDASHFSNVYLKMFGLKPSLPLK